MFKIDRSVVKYIDSNMSDVITQVQIPDNLVSERTDRPMDELQEAPTLFARPDINDLAVQHAQKLVDAAQDNADFILSEAQKEAAVILESAREDGYAQGQRQACEENLIFQKGIYEEFQAFLEELRRLEKSRDESMEANILQLSLEIAEKITNQQLADNDNVFMDMVKEAVRRLNAKEKFIINLNGREYDRFFAEGSGWLSDAVQAAPFTVCADNEVAPGGITLIGQGGMVRAGVDTQLKNVKDLLTLPENNHDEAG